MINARRTIVIKSDRTKLDTYRQVSCRLLSYKDRRNLAGSKEPVIVLLEVIPTAGGTGIRIVQCMSRNLPLSHIGRRYINSFHLSSVFQNYRDCIYIMCTHSLLHCVCSAFTFDKFVCIKNKVSESFTLVYHAN